jgi:hypothetical protein
MGGENPALEAGTATGAAHRAMTAQRRIRLVFRLRSEVRHRERRGAWLARRDEGEYREYLTEEQRREAGCIGARKQHDF